MIVPRLRGDDHDKADRILPFAVGDVEPSGGFIHVLDEVTLDVVMAELDTISDLTAYLQKKAAFVRSGFLMGAHGEEDLVAYYLTHMSTCEEHDFTRPDGSDWAENDFVTIGSHYAELREDERYVAKKVAERDSYVWDRLIRVFTNHMLAGTTLLPEGEQFSLAVHGDRGIRHMAEVPRYIRRSLGAGILDALSQGLKGHRFTRAFMPGANAPNQDTGFFFMTLAVPDFVLPGGYEQYRTVRRNMLQTYALLFLERNPSLLRVVGVGVEPPSDPASSTPVSEDLIVVEQPEWDEELRGQLRESQRAYDIAVEGRYREYQIQYDEWPDVKRPKHPSRAKIKKPLSKRQHQRKARKAQRRKR